MRLEDIDRMLPSGFHDAFLEKLTIDYGERKAVLDLDLSVGDPDVPEKSEREAYRKGRLQLSNLVYCVIEPPHPSSPYREAKELWVDAGPRKELDKPLNLPEPLPEDAFAYWFFVSQWNSFIYVAATDASFTWQGEPHNH